MSIAALIRRMSELGAPAEAIALAVEAIEAEQAKDAARRAKRAEQKARERATKSDKVATVARQSCGEGATVADTDLAPPTPRKEITLVPPSGPTGPQTPRGSRSSGRRLPDDWSPKPEAFEYAAERTLTAEETRQCAAEMREWAHANANRPVARKADWDLTFLGFVRRFAEKKARAGPRPQTSKPMNRWDEFNLKLGEA